MNPSINPSVSLLEHFESIDEPRTEYLIEHQLLDIIAITICAVICGADSWVEIEEYGYSKQEWLQKFLAIVGSLQFGNANLPREEQIKNGIASYIEWRDEQKKVIEAIEELRKK